MSKSKFAPAWHIWLVAVLCVGLFPLPLQVAGANTISNKEVAYSGTKTSLLTEQAPVIPTLKTEKIRGRKFLVDNNQKDTPSKLNTAGATRLVDYGAFSLWTLVGEPETLEKATKLEGAASRLDFEQIYLRDININTTQDAATIARNVRSDLQQQLTSGEQLWLVQFAGPIRADWLDNLKAAGVRPVIYMPSNAYLVWATGKQVAELENMANSGQNFVQWSGAYHPAYRIDPALLSAKGVASRAANEATGVTVQFVNTPAVADSVARLRKLGSQVFLQEEKVLNFVNISLEIPYGEVENVAKWPDVFNIEPWSSPKLHDEIQNQIVAGNANYSTGLLTGAGYLTWITGTNKNFPTTPASYPIIDVVDSGLDNGQLSTAHPDFHVNGNGAQASRVVAIDNCTADAGGNDTGGHGTINAGIIGSYNNLTGAPHVDANGYRRGLGINPFARIGATKIFTSTAFDLSKCGNGFSGVVAKSHAKGAKISANSWGFSTYSAYNSVAQAYDAFVRDGLPATEDNQEMLHVFSASNDGPFGPSIGSPGTAKNVFTVGATENVRDDTITDGCTYFNANNFRDIATFSGRGPTKDNRSKPDIVVPGVHVQGPASKDPGYNASNICGANIDQTSPKYYPVASNTLYTWNSSTSAAAAAAAGGMSLIYEYYGRVISAGATPSPAMAKALALSGAGYLNGLDSGGTLPSISQGWGMLNMGFIFTDTSRFVVDQSKLFTASGQEYAVAGTVASAGRPVRISLVWTDAPGSTTGNNYVNDLNLEVTVGGVTYKGNVFSGASSATGGTADVRNNVETVFVPGTPSGAIKVRVVAANIAGDGVPGNASGFDQDFALVVHNATISDQAFVTQQVTTVSGGDNDGAIEPGETLKLETMVTNLGGQTATTVVGTLASAAPGVTVGSPSSYNFGTLAPNESASNPGNDQYLITIPSNYPCGTPVTLTHSISFGGGTSPQVYTITLPTGQATDTTQTYNSSGGAQNIISTTTTVITSNISVPVVPGAPTTAGKVRVKVNLTHDYLADLDLTLIAPNGTRIDLSSDNGGSGKAYTDTVFDDAAFDSILDGSWPYTGMFKPEQALSGLSAANRAGTWKLEIADDSAGAGGQLLGWSLSFVSSSRVCGNNSVLLTSQQAQTSDGDSTVEPGEAVSLTVTISNNGTSTATGIAGSLASATSGVTVTRSTTSFSNLNTGLTGSNSANPYLLSVSPTLPCGTPVKLVHTLTFSGGVTETKNIELNAGFLLVAPALLDLPSSDVPKTIPANQVSQITSTIAINQPGYVDTLSVTIGSLTHSYVGDLVIRLKAPDGTTVKLFDRRGGNGQNISGLLFDDAASNSISGGVAPFSGAFAPEEILFTLRGKLLSGVWTLVVEDYTPADGGQLVSWSLGLGVYSMSCAVGSNEPTSLTVVSTNPQATQTNTAFSDPFRMEARNAENNLMEGVPLVWSVPTSGPSGAFPASPQTFLQLTGANGQVVAPTFTANGIAGSYEVTATTINNITAVFSLTNAPCAFLTVSDGTDNGLGTNCGTLSYALKNASPAATITLTAPTINVSGGALPALKTGIILDGGACNSPNIVINGTGVAGDGLTLNGSNQLINLTVSGFGGKQIVPVGKANKISCSVASKN